MLIEQCLFCSLSLSLSVTLSLFCPIKAANAMQAKIVVSGGAFHTPLMASAAEKFGTKLQEMQPKMSPPKCDIYMNATGGPTLSHL